MRELREQPTRKPALIPASTLGDPGETESGAGRGWSLGSQLTAPTWSPHQSHLGTKDKGERGQSHGPLNGAGPAGCHSDEDAGNQGIAKRDGPTGCGQALSSDPRAERLRSPMAAAQHSKSL